MAVATPAVIATKPIDTQALDTLTTMVHKAAFNGTGPPADRYEESP